MTSPRLLAATVALVLVLTGCGASEPPEPIRIGSAPDTPTGKIDLALTLDSSGFFEFDQWPDACDLLSDRDVRAVFPQARDIRRKPLEQRMTILPGGVSGARGPPRQITLMNGSCNVSFKLPGFERDQGHPLVSSYQVIVDVDGAGSREVIRKNHGDGLEGERSVRIGGADCLARYSLRCMKGNLAFAIGVQATTQGEVGGVPTLRYQVGPEVSTFTTGDVNAREAKQRFEVDEIAAELAKAVASKI